jgi:hypothetical protein
MIPILKKNTDPQKVKRLPHVNERRPLPPSYLSKYLAGTVNVNLVFARTKMETNEFSENTCLNGRKIRYVRVTYSIRHAMTHFDRTSHKFILNRALAQHILVGGGTVEAP